MIHGTRTGAALLALLMLAAGCKDEPLKVGGLCLSEADCPPSQVCVGGFCSATCATDADCPTGQICRANVCLSECDTHPQCPDGTLPFACVEGACEPVEAPGYAYAGADLEASEGDTVTLSGNGSFVTTEEPSFEWEFVGSVPKGVVAVLEAATAKGDGVAAVSVRFVAPEVKEDTRLTFRLTLRDGDAFSQDTVDVTVRNTINEAPTAAVTASVSEAAVGEPIELSAEGSTDPNPEDTLSYTWTYGLEETGDALTIATETLTDDGARVRILAPAFPVDTAVLVRLVASDGEDSDEATVVVLVKGTADFCDPGDPDACDDGSPCTEETCSEAHLCVRTPANEGGACDDGDPCTGDGVCTAGECAAGAPITCDDGIACTDDSCGDEGCVYRPNGQPCDLTGECPKPVITVAEGTNVIPLTLLHLSAAGSHVFEAPIVAWKWTVKQPKGSAGKLSADDVQEPTFRPNVVGVYRFSLTVTDGAGKESCAPTDLEVVVTPAALMHVEVTWHTPGDPDESDEGFQKGADLDLHVLHPNAIGADVDGDGEPDGWFNKPWDCFWFNPKPPWTATLDRDDVDGAGPENLSFQQLEPGAVYRVGIHYWDDNGFGPSFATLRIYAEGKLVLEVADVELVPLDLWRAATIGPGLTVNAVTVPGGGHDIVPGYVDPAFDPN